MKKYNHKEIAKRMGKGKQLYPHQKGNKTVYTNKNNNK
jgi:hypothetical protein